MGQVKQAFEQQVVAILLDRILSTRQIDKGIHGSKKYASILSSIRELGVVEPLAVHPQPVAEHSVASYVLLDGLLRLEALKELGGVEALCLISTDDEGFTYNRQINRLTPIQEHKMILAALKKGIDPALVARVLVLFSSTEPFFRLCLSTLGAPTHNLNRFNTAYPYTSVSLKISTAYIQPY
ncbi:ParB/RepB/Spo0J family partition protein [Pseudomonas stutzeri]|nr:ParB/RepB/Spo0J family partition protein [Stutzerimonas stutzeri]MCQ4313350.1 ParB/RepB/Spo0J family partition protein [Stutzerimonas stutzeri]